MFQKDNIGQSIWDICGAIGNMLGEQFENLNEEQSENLMGTIGNPKNPKSPTPLTLPKRGKKRNKTKPLGCIAFSPHWLPSICMSTCDFLHFWPTRLIGSGLNSVTKA